MAGVMVSRMSEGEKIQQFENGADSELDNTVVVIRGYYMDDCVRKNYEKLRDDLRHVCDVVFLYDSKPGKMSGNDVQGPAIAFNQDDWRKYKRPDPFNKAFIPGNEETMFLMFADAYPAKEFYWFIEYDVVFSGDWREFIMSFADRDSDLIATTLIRYREIPDWKIWRSIVAPEANSLGEEEMLRSFLPVCRFSARALDTLRSQLAAGWSGHPEALVASLLLHEGYFVEDLGGTGEFVRPENYGRFYSNTPSNPDLSPGTFVFRPKMERAGDLPNMLWHPVKSDKVAVWDTPPSRLVRLRRWASQKLASFLGS